VGEGGGETGEGDAGGGEVGGGGVAGAGGDDGGDATTCTSMCEWIFATSLYRRQKKYNPGDWTFKWNAGNWFASPTNRLPRLNPPSMALVSTTPQDSSDGVDAPFMQHSRASSLTKYPCVPIDWWNATGRSARILDM